MLLLKLNIISRCAQLLFVKIERFTKYGMSLHTILFLSDEKAYLIMKKNRMDFFLSDKDTIIL